MSKREFAKFNSLVREMIKGGIFDPNEPKDHLKFSKEFMRRITVLLENPQTEQDKTTKRNLFGQYLRECAWTTLISFYRSIPEDKLLERWEIVEKKIDLDFREEFQRLNV